MDEVIYGELFDEISHMISPKSIRRVVVAEYEDLLAIEFRRGPLNRKMRI
ncbi:MAG TPA: hypothetical protein PLM88_02260 [Bacillota bacterium]|nr:hypothetical protein [Bacillota bacterium]